jgi:Ca2+-binding RTX toxin-like protein
LESSVGPIERQLPALSYELQLATLSGTPGNDALLGTSDDDTISGLAGDDTLNGGVGNDSLDGGAGSDTASYVDASGGVTVGLAISGAQTVGGGQGVDTLVSIERLIGSSFADTLSGSSAGDTLVGGDGSDTLVGGDGNDFIDPGRGDDSVAGGRGDDYLYAGGSDLFHGPADDGADTIDGGEGIDWAVYDYRWGLTQGINFIVTEVGPNPADEFLQLDPVSGKADTLRNIEGLVIHGGAGNDTLVGSSRSDNFIGNGGNDLLLGGNGGDQLNGAFGNDSAYGGAGDDYFNKGGDGSDLVDGGEGYDTYFINLEWVPNGATFQSLWTGAGQYVQPIPAGFQDTISGIERIQIGGSQFSDQLTGDDGDNQIDGQAGNDSLSGGAGNDSLIGGLGNDVFRPGAGSDTINGGQQMRQPWIPSITGDYDWIDYAGSEGGIKVNLTTRKVLVAREAGTDTYSGIERINGVVNVKDTVTGRTSGSATVGDGSSIYLSLGGATM